MASASLLCVGMTVMRVAGKGLMTNLTPDDQGTPISSRAGISTRDLLGMAVQGVIIFVGVSILFGRVYFLRFYSFLGVPYAEIENSPLDYAIMSPDVAIVSVGLAIALPAAVAVQAAIIGGRVEPLGRKTWAIISIGLILASAVSMIGFVFVINSFGSVFVGVRGTLTALPIVFLLGAASIGTFPVRPAQPVSTQVIGYIGMVAALGLSVFMVLLFPLVAAREDAKEVWTGSESIILNLQSDMAPDHLLEVASSAVSTSTPVRVLAFGKNHTYAVTSADVRVWDHAGLFRETQARPDIFAIPNSAISGFRVVR